MQPGRLTGSALAWLLLILCAFAGPAVAQTPPPHATLDRNEIALGESVTLTIHIATASPTGEPDWQPLQRDFQVLQPRRSSRHVIRNGRAESSTQWEVTLLPRQAGSYTLPSLAVGDAHTEPLALRVLPARSQPAGSEPIFLETSVDRDSVYVEQQLLLTIRIHHAVPLDDMRLTEPEFDHATVHKVGQDSYSREIDGNTFRVHELRYAIFFHQPGELIIPELAFTATRLQRPRSLFDFPGQGQPISQLTSRAEITVQPVPAAFTGPVWLPARNLTLVESWSQSPQQLRVGESATRTLTLRADGQPADRLPPLPQPDLAPRARFYADQPQLDNRVEEHGMTGTRIDSAALIASEPGPLELPGIKVIWWDVESDQQRVAEIPAQRLEVGAAIGASTASPAVADAEAPKSQPASPPPADAASARPAVDSEPDWLDRRRWPWIAALTLALLGWGYTAWRYRLLRRRLRTSGSAAVQASDEATLFHTLLGHCAANQAEPARRALLAWARHFYDEPALRSTRGLRAHLRDEPTTLAALDALDAALFDSQPWDGRPLAEAMARERKAARTETGGTELPPLYPSP